MPSPSKQVALLGADTLLGREIKDVLGSRGSGIYLTPFLLDQEEPATAQGGEEAVALDVLTPKTLQSISAVVLAGSDANAASAYDLVKTAANRPVIIDCTGTLESRPETKIVAPLVEEQAGSSSWLQVVAHPVSSAVVLVLSRLGKHLPIRSVVANVFGPASERGKPGVTELHQQTTALLNFKPLEKTVFDTQVSFNLLPRLGEEAPHSLLTTEVLIDRQIATLLSRQSGSSAVPIPSIRLMQAPVFHGYSLSLWVEFAANARSSDVEEALASAQIEIRRNDEEPPDNVGVASQSGLIAGDIRVDNNNPRAVWIWVVLDNLRSVADAAAELVRAVVNSKGSSGA